MFCQWPLPKGQRALSGLKSLATFIYKEAIPK